MEDFIKKAKETKSVEELKALAGEYNFEMDDEKAKKYFSILQSGEALSEDELNAISGGQGSSLKKCPNCSQYVTVSSKGSTKCPYCGAFFSPGFSFRF